MRNKMKGISLTICMLFSAYIFGVDLYWVGGSGDYIDFNHWSFTSGGFGGDGTPTINDNVIFDANSFDGPGQTVNISGDIFCQNMDWTGVTNTPILDGDPSAEVNIHGSLTFVTAMRHFFGGNYNFRTNAPLTHFITSAGQAFLADVIFDGGAQWILTDDLNVIRTIEFREGVFLSGGVGITAFSIYSDFQTQRVLDFTNSIVQLRQMGPGNPSNAIFGGNNLTWQSADATFRFTGTASFMRLMGNANFRFEEVFFQSDNSLLASETDLPPTINNLQFALNGEIEGNHTINNWTLSMGYTVFLSNGSVQNLDQVITGDDCDGLAVLVLKDDAGMFATLNFEFPPFSLDGLFLRGVHGANDDNRTITLFDSQNGGNTGDIWVFQNTSSTDKYWVGGTGDWNDRDNWSDMSGGPGGACLPKPNDNIFFDNNSFTGAPNAVVSGIAPAFANNFTFTASNFNGRIDLPSLFINGNLTLTNPVNWDVRDVYLIGNNQAGNSGNTDVQFISTGPVDLINLFSQSQRRVIIESDLILSGDLIIDGNGPLASFNVAGYRVIAERIISIDSDVTINLDMAELTAFGERVGDMMPIILRNVRQVNDDRSTWVLTNDMATGIEADGINLGSLIFESETGLGVVLSTDDELTFDGIRMRGDGEFRGSDVTIDELEFSAGHIYEIEAGVIVKVDSRFIALGTICDPIRFQSTAAGFSSQFDISTVSNSQWSYLEIKDLDAINNAPFAGEGSADLGNNSGWTFPSDNQNASIRQFLGDDQTSCADASVRLQPFGAEEVQSIDWNNGESADLAFDVMANGMMNTEVIARVMLTGGCELTDTVMINFDQAFSFAVGQDTTICEGESLRVDVAIPSVAYVWSTGDTGPVLNISESGTYIVDASRGTCMFSDTIVVSRIEVEDFSLGQDTTFCENTIYNLVAPVLSSGSFVWSDGSTENSLMIRDPGVYWIEVGQDRCVLRDSVEVSFDAAIGLTLGPDTIICAGTAFELDAGANMDSYNWNTGSMDQTIPIVSSGNYEVEVVRGACQERSFVFVGVSDIPAFPIGDDTRLCEGDSLALTIPPIAGNPNIIFEWYDGRIDAQIQVTESGTYWLEAREGQCTRRDSIDVQFDPAIVPFNIGNDTSLCENESLIIDAGASLDSYLWSTGSTDQTITVDAEGMYEVAVNRGACSATDAIMVSVVTIESFSLGSDTTLCEGQILQLEYPANIPPQSLWSDGTREDSILIATSGTYWLEVGTANCVLRDSLEVSFDAAITLELGNDTTLCENEMITLDAGAGMDAYLWSTGSTDQTITVSSQDSYDVTISRGACSLTDAKVVSVVTIEPFSLGADTTLCEGQTLQLEYPANTPPQSMWSDGTSSDSILITTTGTYWLEVGAANCALRDSVVVNFDAAITLELGNDTTLCENEMITLDAGPGMDAYLWSTGSTDQAITVSSQDSYDVTISRGACSLTDAKVVSVVTIEPFSLGADTTLCEGQTLQLEYPANTPPQSLWSDGTSSDSILITAGGIYWLEVGAANCSQRDSLNVVFDAAINLDLGSDTTLCDGETLFLDAAVTADMFTWSTGETDPTISITTPTSLSLVAVDGACIETDTIDIQFISLDGLSIGNDSSLCEGQLLLVDASLPGVSNYEWTEVLSGDVVSTDPMFTISQSGDYEVVVSAERCSTSDDIRVTFDEAINFEGLGPDTTLCIGEMLQFDITIPGVNLLWQDGRTDSDYTLQNAGSYNLELTRGACIEQDTLEVAVRALPTVDLPTEVQFCEGEMQQLDASMPGLTYLWSDASTDSVLTVTQAGEYSVIVNDGVCENGDSTTVIINPLPFVMLGSDTSICDGSSLNIGIGTGTEVILWSTGETTPEIRIGSAGTYRVTVMSAEGCSASDSLELTVNTAPIFQLDERTGLCDGEQATLTVPVMYETLVWSTGETTMEIQVSTEQIVWAEAAIGTCNFRDSTEVVVQMLPTVNLGADTTICDGVSLTLDANFPDATYLWSSGETTPTLDVMAAGDYSVVVDINGCTAMDDLVLNLQPSPMFDLGSNLTLCAGESTTLNTGTTEGSTIWSTGETGNMITVDAAATYTATVDLNGCMETREVRVDIEALPAFSLGDDIAICAELSNTSLTVDVPNVDVLWSTGATGNSIIVRETGTYSASAMTSNGCEFTDVIEISNRACQRFSIYRPNAFNPFGSEENNMFRVSPSDPQNIIEYSIAIFDRWGNVLFESLDFNEPWDGRVPGYSAQPGVYTYSIKVRYFDDFEDDRTEVMNGSFTLIR